MSATCRTTEELEWRWRSTVFGSLQIDGATYYALRPVPAYSRAELSSVSSHYRTTAVCSARFCDRNSVRPPVRSSVCLANAYMVTKPNNRRSVYQYRAMWSDVSRFLRPNFLVLSLEVHRTQCFKDRYPPL